jgi:hypothetical protein
MHWKDSVHRPGPKYMRRLSGSSSGEPSPDRRDTIAVVLDELGDAMAVALKEVLDQAVRTDASVYVLFVLTKGDGLAVPELLALSREIGDELSTWVLRMCAGTLPRVVNVVVYWGGPGDVLGFMNASVRPSLVTMVHRDDPHGGLAAAILRLPNCPVLLIPGGGAGVGESAAQSGADRRKPELLN